MKRVLRPALITLAVLAAAALSIPLIRACAPEGPSLVFTWEKHPDLPLNAFAQGRLGILQPSYARSYLVVAYRYLTDAPLEKTEQEGALAFWDSRLHGGVELPPGPDEMTEAAAPPSADVWMEARSAYPKASAEAMQTLARANRYYIENISPDAFNVATTTLRDRSKRWDRLHLEAWIQAQDRVFSCNLQNRDFPVLAAADEAPLFRADRAYQMAAAQFYGARFDEARAGFQAITEDAQSPYRRLAAYLIGRCWVRQGELEKEPAAIHACYVRAHDVFQALKVQGYPAKPDSQAPEPLDDAALKAAAEDAEARMSLHADPVGAAHAFTQNLLHPASQGRFGPTLASFSNLLDQQIQGEWEAEDKHDMTLRRIPPALLAEDLAEWVYRFQETGPKAFRLAEQRWRERQSLPWLLMALANAEPNSQGVSELLAAASKVPSSHPAFESLGFHRARLLVVAGRKDEARQLVDAFLSRKDSVSSSENLWRALRMPLARDAESTLADLLRTPVGIRSLFEGPSLLGSTATTSCGVQATHPKVRKLMQSIASMRFLEGDGALMLNFQVPTDVLIRFARNPKTPAHLRREWIRAAWTRSVVLDRWDLVRQITPDLISQEPQLKESLEAFQKASTEDQPRVALLVLLRHPGLNWMVFQGIHHRSFVLPGEKPIPLRYRDTYLAECWWRSTKPQDDNAWRNADLSKLTRTDEWSWPACFYYPEPHLVGMPLGSLRGKQVEAPSWLSREQKAQAERERRQLLVLESGPVWLCRRTLAWAHDVPGDPNLPEALHLAVRASRIDNTGELSGQCFRWLHKHFESSPWAKKTPYHY